MIVRSLLIAIQGIRVDLGKRSRYTVACWPDRDRGTSRWSVVWLHRDCWSRGNCRCGRWGEHRGSSCNRNGSSLRGSNWSYDCRQWSLRAIDNTANCDSTIGSRYISMNVWTVRSVLDVRVMVLSLGHSDDSEPRPERESIELLVL